jgi:hypothetical protein
MTPPSSPRECHPFLLFFLSHDLVVSPSYDDFGDLSEDLDILAKGDIGLFDAKDRLKETIKEIGPDAAQGAC